MTKCAEPKRLKDLLKLLGGLQKLHEQLLELVQAKMDTMRRADISGMRELNERERTLAKRLQQREGLRCQLMDQIGNELGMPPRTARAIPLSQMASRIPEPGRERLLDAAQRLRQVVAQVARGNRVVGVISREILNHLRWVFASVTPKEEKPVGYSVDGLLVGSSKVRIFETVG